MHNKGWLLRLSLLCIVILIATQPVLAQGGAPLLAFLNSSGQLVISSGDGGYRWIVTNPGENLNRQIGYAWSPQGRQVFFALGGAGDVSLRVADPASQSVGEIGRVGGQVSGGQWLPDGSAVLVAVDNRLLAFPAVGGEPVQIAAAEGAVTLRSPFDNANRVHQPQARVTSPNGDFLLYSINSQLVFQPLNLSPQSLAGGVSDSPYSGLWADSAPLVAYTASSNGNSALAVTNTATGETLVLDSGRTAPINAIGWRPGSLELVYRDATNFIRLADLSCMTSGCGSNPLQSGIELAPGSASEIQIDGSFVYYVDNGTVKAADLACVQVGGCVENAVTLGGNAAPQTMLHIGGGTLVYTAQNGGYEVRAVDLRCLSNPASCQAVPVLSGAIAGLVSPDGAYVVVEQVGGGLNALRLTDGQLTYLSDPAGQSLLPYARWNG